MWVRASGQLSENVNQFTTAVSSHLLYQGEQVALVDGTITAVSQALSEQVKSALEVGKTVQYLLVTHGHFDHLASIPQLRKTFPQLQVLGSALLAERLRDGGERENVWAKNAECSTAMQFTEELDFKEWSDLLFIDQVLRDGDVLSLGDEIEIKAISSLGHTEEGLSYFLRPDGALAGGEALGGFHGRGKISSCFMSGYSDWMENLDKLATLEINIIGFPHSGALTGELAKTYLMNARQAAQQLHDSIKQGLDNGELVDEICARLLPEMIEQGIVAEGPFREMVNESVQQMVQVVAEEG